MLVIKPANPQTDYVRLAELYDAAHNRPISADDLHARDEQLGENDIRLSFAAWLDERIIGYGYLSKQAASLDKHISLWVTIDKDFRGKGYGNQLFEHLLQLTEQYSYNQLEGECLDNDAISLQFAKNRGFGIRKHTFKNALDLTQFDLSQWQHIIDSVEVNSIAFNTLEKTGSSEAIQRDIHVLHNIAQHANTMNDGRYQPSFEVWRKIVFEAFWFKPEMMTLAFDDEHIVGMGITSTSNDNPLARNGFLGVHPDYRGRKIATVLKLKGIAYALRKGATKIITTNDSENHAMLAVNSKLGYKREVGMYYVSTATLPD